MLARRRVLAGAGVIIVIALGGLASFWYVVLRDDAPPAVSLASALASASSTPTPDASPAIEVTTTAAATATNPVATPEPTAPEPTAPEPATTVLPSADDPASLVGTWVLSQQGDSFVGYRVQEELASIGAATAVGRTATLTAELEYDGTAIIAASVEADMTQLRSDDSRRDRTLRRQALETGAFPTASFELTSPFAIGAVVDGEPVAAIVSGELTLHGVTREVTLDLEGQFSNGMVVIVGSTEIIFADYAIAQPTSFALLSIDDRGVLELQLVFERA